MTTRVKAIYEKGVFRPVGDVALAEGTNVEVLVPEPRRDPAEVAAKLSKLADQMPRTGRTESTSRDHDRFLYGEQDSE